MRGIQTSYGFSASQLTKHTAFASISIKSDCQFPQKHVNAFRKQPLSPLTTWFRRFSSTRCELDRNLAIHDGAPSDSDCHLTNTLPYRWKKNKAKESTSTREKMRKTKKGKLACVRRASGSVARAFTFHLPGSNSRCELSSAMKILRGPTRASLEEVDACWLVRWQKLFRAFALVVFRLVAFRTRPTSSQAPRPTRLKTPGILRE